MGRRPLIFYFVFGFVLIWKNITIGLIELDTIHHGPTGEFMKMRLLEIPKVFLTPKHFKHMVRGSSQIPDLIDLIPENAIFSC